MVSNLARDVIVHGRITTTETRAKMARPVVERLVTYGKKGDVAARREALKVIRDRDVIHRLFNEVAPRYEDRNGGTPAYSSSARARATTRPWWCWSWSNPQGA